MDAMQEIFIAKKRLTINGKYRLPGQPVPEAAGWKNRKSWINTGHIERQVIATPPSVAEISDVLHTPEDPSPSSVETQTSEDIPKNYCAKCKKTYKTTRGYKKHMARVHESRPESENFCAGCDKSFRTAGGYEKHMARVHE